MKAHGHGRWLRSCVLVAAGICLSAGMLNAARWQGTFTLSSDTRWGAAILPPGEYTFMLDTLPSTGQPVMTLWQGTHGVGIVAAMFGERMKSSQTSRLLIVRDGEMCTVIGLYVSRMDLEFHFNAPKGFEVYHKLITQGHPLPALEEIPVSIAGK